MTGTIEQLKDLMNDEVFVQKISKMENNEEVQKAFSERGIDFTMEEINQIVEMVYENNTELGEDKLEEVSGGFAITTTTLAVVGCITAGISLLGGVMSEVNKGRKEKGKKPIW